MVDKTPYNCVLSQTFSPCGNYLVCGNNYGNIVVYNLTNVLNKSENNPNKSPSCSFTSPNHEQICSMVSTNRFCITGTVGVIYGWEWDSLKEGKPQLQWKINLPSPLKRFDQIDVNSLFVTEDDQVKYLYAGCGDNKIYVFSLEDGKLVRTFEGHNDYLHSIRHCDWQMVSGSEDGTARLWDLRQYALTAMVEPASEHSLARPHLGKWIGDVDVNSNWLICGGGSRAGLWDMRSLELSAAFSETHDAGIHVTKLHEDSVMIGGNDDFFYRFDLKGEVLSKIETSSSTIYSAVYIEKPIEVLSLAGSSNSIDLCTDLSYRYQVLSFFDEAA
ncbi:THO complex subunit 6 [Halyomorpha halys]|uniref:THO complex subunit 6 n=1 Tax=Halyomorpha halys TaxID=286706 RepID=UPI0006D4F42A|nr:THO complex subunit 6 [Halyomorpha halys]